MKEKKEIPTIERLIILALVPVNLMILGLVVNCFWAWFLVPVLPSLSEIGVAQGIGVAFFISLFHHGKSCDNKTALEKAKDALLGKSFLLLFGLITHLIISA